MQLQGLIEEPLQRRLGVATLDFSLISSLIASEHLLFRFIHCLINRLFLNRRLCEAKSIAGFIRVSIFSAGGICANRYRSSLYTTPGNNCNRRFATGGMSGSTTSNAYPDANTGSVRVSSS
jgi:hypothetical protein